MLNLHRGASELLNDACSDENYCKVFYVILSWIFQCSFAAKYIRSHVDCIVEEYKGYRWNNQANQVPKGPSADPLGVGHVWEGPHKRCGDTVCNLAHQNDETRSRVWHTNNLRHVKYSVNKPSRSCQVIEEVTDSVGVNVELSKPVFAVCLIRRFNLVFAALLKRFVVLDVDLIHEFFDLFSSSN